MRHSTEEYRENTTAKPFRSLNLKGFVYSLAPPNRAEILCGFIVVTVSLCAAAEPQGMGEAFRLLRRQCAGGRHPRKRKQTRAASVCQLAQRSQHASVKFLCSIREKGLTKERNEAALVCLSVCLSVCPEIVHADVPPVKHNLRYIIIPTFRFFDKREFWVSP